MGNHHHSTPHHLGDLRILCFFPSMKQENPSETVCMCVFFHVFVDGVRVVKGEVLFKVWMFLWVFLSGIRYH